MAVRIVVVAMAPPYAATRPNVREREKGEEGEKTTERERGAGVASRTDESARLLVVF